MSDAGSENSAGSVGDVNGASDAVGGLLLAVNAGSSSLKLGVHAQDTGATLDIHVDHHRGGIVTLRGDTTLAARLAIPDAAGESPSARNASVLGSLVAQLAPRAAVHRVVHGGDETRECVRIDARERARLQELATLAPLHQPPSLALVDAIATQQPALPQYACLDTAFHATLPPVARDYALPAHIRARFPALRAYGFHGLSCRSAVDALRAEGALPSRLVVAHLGSGASVTAVRDGDSVATSMGFSALEGLVMATRPGRLDPGVLLHLLRHADITVDQLETLLYRRSGLLGLSGLSGDLRELLASDAPAAHHAVEYFCHRAATEIAGLAVALGGIDLLLFTGGVGEHLAPVRDAIHAKLSWMGALPTRVLPCDEQGVMLRALRRARSQGR